jgi:hypothetical protein
VASLAQAPRSPACPSAADRPPLPCRSTRRSRPPIAPTEPADARALLLEFLRQRDVACPNCGYNLRNLTRAECPECREALHLRVERPRPGFGLFVIALAPSIFSGICGVMLLAMLLSFGSPRWPAWLLDGFGLLSGLHGLALFVWRNRFVRLPADAQLYWAAVTWIIQIAVFVLVVSQGP